MTEGDHGTRSAADRPRLNASSSSTDTDAIRAPIGASNQHGPPHVSKTTARSQDQVHGPSPTSGGEQRGLSRRELLKRAGAATAVGLVPLGIASCGDVAGLHAAYGQLQALTIEQAAALDAATARLIPTDENGPGAREAKVLRYIDRALATAYREQQPAYAAGLAALDQYSRTRFGARFARLAPDKQDLLLVGVEEGAAAGFEPSSSVFFATVLQHTLEGMFGDPFWGGNANFVGWDLIGFNGIQLTWTAEMQQLDAAESIAPTVFPAHQGMAGLPGYTAQQIEGVLDD